MAAPQLILASASPRRRELLGLLGLPLDYVTADLDESPQAGEKPGPYVTRLAQEKAAAGWARWQASRPAANRGLLVAADTTVADGDEILGKPEDPAQAQAMLAQLRGRTHQVFTAISVLDGLSGQSESGLCLTQVTMRAYSAEEVAAYIASGDPFDKAGGYAIQNRSFHPVAGYSGCYANVMGLPVCLLVEILGRFGLDCRVGTPTGCPAGSLAEPGYTCSVCQQLASRPS